MSFPIGRYPLSKVRRARAAAAAGVAVIGAGFSAGGAAADEPAASSEWAQGHNVRTRVIAGGVLPSPASAPAGTFLAGVEIDMAEGWKTYWRNPGDAGGIPPGFDWSRSTNLASVRVLYPAPMRMRDAAGTTIGYKGNVVFPVIVEPADTTRAVDLKLDFTFGTCREICVPGEAVHEVSLQPGGTAAAPAALDAAMARVPLADASSPSADRGPRLEKSEIILDGPSPRVTLHVAFAGDTAGADVFAEGPAGEYVPMPQLKSETAGGVRIYEIDLTDGADVAALKGQALTLTLVSQAASREVRLALP
ncbi:MAG: protein-disulfide reductase DsbD domain-containing protein [Hyphomicrobiaceae bacterium]